MRGSPGGRSRLTFVGGLIALGLATAGAADMFIGRPFGFDFSAYLIAAHRLVAGISPYPVTPVFGPAGQFFYPPTAALFFVPFTWLPESVAVALWTLMVASAAVLLGTALVRRFPPRWRLWAAAGVVFYVPLLWDVTLGNVTTVVVALAFLGWHLRERLALAALALAGSLLLKPLVVAVVPFLVLARPRLALWVAGWCAAGVILTLPWAGVWVDYVRLLIDVTRAPVGTGSNLVPLAFGEGPARVLLPALAMLAALAAGAAARRSPTLSGHGFHLALAASPLLFTTLWYPFLTTSLPLLLRPASWSGPVWGSRAARGFVVALWALIQMQLLPEAGRSFTLPFIALIGVVALGSARLRSDE